MKRNNLFILRSVNSNEKIDFGQVFTINKRPGMICMLVQMAHNEFNIINLEDGNRWANTNVKYDGDFVTRGLLETYVGSPINKIASLLIQERTR